MCSPILRERDRLEYLGFWWEDNVKMDLQEEGWWGVWTGLMWFRIGAGGALL